MLHFGRRGRENLRDLQISDFSCSTDADGWKYVYLNKDELTKSHQNDPNSTDGRMYEIKDDPRCPVQSFLDYISMLAPRSTTLFSRARKTKNKSGYYFDKAPMGHNKLGTMMALLSEKAGLSLKYSNHSLRATSVHILESAQVPTRHIMTVTVHKAESSLKTYTGYTDENTKKHMSHTISRSMGLRVENAENGPPRKVSRLANQPGIEILNNVQYGRFEIQEFDDEEFNALLRDIPDLSSLHTNNAQAISYSAPQIISGVWPFPAPVISGQYANVTINYQMLQKSTLIK
ncbi:uncharacterized protein LOC134237796 [Saccostrea cucullata]|uniref:uncharacterized protein LOC134237796 n=1 Tax=Saccostrea cuccullata TaxID=36930 RepID=UPI002ED190C1